MASRNGREDCKVEWLVGARPTCGPRRVAQHRVRPHPGLISGIRGRIEVRAIDKLPRAKAAEVATSASVFMGLSSPPGLIRDIRGRIEVWDQINIFESGTEELWNEHDPPNWLRFLPDFIDLPRRGAAPTLALATG
ncbi:MAG: hypothetical protein ABIZ04_01125 [Opitutus sp.]